MTRRRIESRVTHSTLRAGMAEAEPTRASGGLQALNSGSGLYKLVKLGHVEATYAPTDIEVAHIEAQFIGPDLRDAEKELLQIAGSEETERKALLDRCAQYDAILDHLNAKTGDAKPAKDTSDVHTTSTHGMDFAQQVRPPARPTPRTPGQFRPSFSRTERGATWFFARERTTLRARNAPSSRTSAAAIDPRDARKPTTRADARLPPSTNAQTASGFDAPDSATRLPAPLIRAGASRFSANSQTVFPYVDLQTVSRKDRKKPGAMRASEAHSVDRATSRNRGRRFFRENVSSRELSIDRDRLASLTSLSCSPRPTTPTC